MARYSLRGRPKVIKEVSNPLSLDPEDILDAVLKRSKIAAALSENGISIASKHKFTNSKGKKKPLDNEEYYNYEAF